MSRTAAGVKAIRLKAAPTQTGRGSDRSIGGDFVAGLDIIKQGGKEQIANSKLLIVTENGFAKQTSLKEYKIQSRGGSGIKTAKITAKTGNVVVAQIVGEEEELLALSSKGQIIKTKMADIRTASRATSGVRIMRLKAEDKVVGAVLL